MAAIHAVLYPGFEADKDHPGYLIKFEPPIFLRIPYHVLPTFPTGRELEQLWELSREIRSGNRSMISLSGSNVMRRIFDVVGDIDFCEYFPITDADGVAKIVSNLDGTSHLACLKLAFAGRKWQYPWGNDKPTQQFFSAGMDCKNVSRSTLKVDYVGDVDRLGVTEITNLIIAIDENGKSAGLAKTFAAQEAPLVPIDLLPNQMNDPFEMGRYINWLANSIEEHMAKGDMRKCLKRYASLSRVIFRPEIADSIADLANSSAVMLAHKAAELAKVSALLRPLTDDRSISLLARLDRQSSELSDMLAQRGGPPDDPARRAFDEQAGQIAKRLLGHIRPDPHSKRAA